MKKLSRILSAILSFGLLATTACVMTSTAAEHADITIPYVEIAQGQVDKKDYGICEKTTDPEKGKVYKLTANPDASEDGVPTIDAWSLDKYKIDLNHYKTLRLEYKYTSNSDTKYSPYVAMSAYGGKTLKYWKGTNAKTALEKDKWTTIDIDLDGITKGNLGTDGILWQMHIAPFGQVKCKSLTDGETILIGKITFTADAVATLAEETEAKSVNIEFLYNRSGLTNPAKVSAMSGTVITLPTEAPVSGEKKLSKWFCENDSKYYELGDKYTVPAADVKFLGYWEALDGTPDPIKISYADYTGGIMNRVDTATLETLDYEGKKAVKAVPNPNSENGAKIILDGWTYNGAKVDASKYSTIIMIYKYLSERPVTTKAGISILKWQEFSKGTNMASREIVREGKWAAVSFDMSGARDNIIPGKIANLTQMHISPLGENKVGTLLGTDEIYVADLIFIPEKTKSASYNASFIGGYTDGTFKPNGNMTIAEACTVIARIMADGDSNVATDTKSSFADVTESDWFARYVVACEKAQLLTSFSGNLEPNRNITRAEFVELVYKMGLLADKGKNGSFTDVPEGHARAEVISAAGKSGLVNGYANGDGTFSFRPDNTITRTEVVKVINNALGRSANIDAVKNSGCRNAFSDVDESFWGYSEILGAANTHIAYVTEDGKEMWLPMDTVLDESGFTPDYDAAIAKAAEIDALMVKRIEEIRSTPDTITVKDGGKRIYISNKGSDENDGLSEKTPVATVAAAQKIAKAGDAILFERGGEWRVNFTTVSGVSYGAYGVGAKPLINGNTTGDAADPSLWTLVPGTTNIYTYRDKLRDVGNLIYNGGALYTDKIVPSVNDKLELCVASENKKYDPATSHKKNNTFFMVYDSITSQTLSMPNVYGTLYVRCDEGNPGEVYDSIEIASYGHAIVAKSDNYIENLCIMYAGGHGITAGTCENLVIRNCEIGWIGGTSQYINNGRNTRYGNGIQIYGGCDNFVIDNCYVYECYDAGISPQYSAVGTNEILLERIYYTNNVIDKCIYNIEYFMGKTESGNAERHFETMHYTGNILARSGYGWGMNPSRSACIKGWDHYNKASDFIIKDNIILNPAYNAYHIGADFEGWLPVFSGNTYIIRRNSEFVKYGANGSSQYMYNSLAAQTAKTVLGETDYKLYYLPEDYVTPTK